MTCFVNRLDKKGYFKNLGITVTKENAKAIEEAIGKTVGKSGEHCPAIWREMKFWLHDPRKKAALERDLKKKFGKESGT